MRSAPDFRTPGPTVFIGFQSSGSNPSAPREARRRPGIGDRPESYVWHPGCPRGTRWASWAMCIRTVSIREDCRAASPLPPALEVEPAPARRGCSLLPWRKPRARWHAGAERGGGARMLARAAAKRLAWPAWGDGGEGWRRACVGLADVLSPRLPPPGCPLLGHIVRGLLGGVHVELEPRRRARTGWRGAAAVLSMVRKNNRPRVARANISAEPGLDAGESAETACPSMSHRRRRQDVRGHVEGCRTAANATTPPIAKGWEVGIGGRTPRERHRRRANNRVSTSSVPRIARRT